MNPKNIKQTISINLYRTILIVVSVAIVLLFAILLMFDLSNSLQAALSAITGSLIAGLLLVLIEQLLQWNQHRQTEELAKLRIHRILPHREGKEFYKKHLDLTAEKIWVLGVTGSRFLEDFAHSSRDDSQSIQKAIGRGVMVRILLPHEKYLTEQQKRNYANAKPRIADLCHEFGDQFAVKYFDHIPMHSIVIMDETALLGPVFPRVESKDSPAICLDTKSVLFKPYFEYFNAEWVAAKGI